VPCWFFSMLVAPGAGAATPPTTSAPGSVRVSLPDGTSVDLPGDPHTLSAQQLAAAGVAPGKDGVQLAHVGFTATPPSRQVSSGLSPDNALGKCNGSVCEDVYGSGTWVQWWDSYGTLAIVGCTYAAFWEPLNTIWALSPTYCSSIPYYPLAHVVSGLPHQFARWSVACATLLHLAGKPCALIY